jgi:hypothetical protein
MEIPPNDGKIKYRSFKISKIVLDKGFTVSKKLDTQRQTDKKDSYCDEYSFSILFLQT